VNRDRPFFRTPKRAARHAWLQGLAAAREETFLMLGLWFAALAVAHIPEVDGNLTGLVGSPDLTVWVAVLLVQSIPYCAALVVALVSAMPWSGEWIGETGIEAMPDVDAATTSHAATPATDPAAALAVERRA
jgi:hypothetical protein